MQRPSGLVSCGWMVLVLVISGCGGGGGGGGGGSAQADAPTSTPPPTPLRTVSSRNQRTEASDAGAITLRVGSVVVLGDQTTQFSVLLTDANGRPVADEILDVEAGFGLGLLSPTAACSQPPSQGTTCREGTTGPDGSLSGSVAGLSGGTYGLTVTVIGPSGRSTEADPLQGLAVTLAMVVSAPAVTDTPTVGEGTTTPAPATATPTALPCTDVQTIIVQTDTLNVSSQAGGKAKITATVFNSDNRPVPQVNVLFDVQPRIAAFDMMTQTTGNDGTALTHLNVPPNSSFGPLAVSGSACGKQGSVTVNVVSGVSTKPVATVVLQADPSTIGSITGGDINLTAAILDADNAPIEGIDVLFITSIGRVSPLIDRSKVSGSQGGIATAVLQIPAGAIEQPYTISAVAGGVSGSTVISVVPGRGGQNTGPKGVPPGEPASITLGASPTRIQVAGTGGTELSTIIGRVFDNNGNPIANVRVYYHVAAGQSAPGALILPVTTPTPSGTPVASPTTACAPDDPVSVSDNAGFALIQVHSGSAPGPVTVVACTDTTIYGVPSPLFEQQTLVTVTSGPVSRIALSMNPRSVDNNDGTLVGLLTAIVTDAQGNFVEDGTPVFFEILTNKICSGGTNDGQSCSTDSSCGGGTCVDDDTDPSRNVAIAGGATTNAAPPCDTSQFVVQTGLPVTAQPGDATTCIKYPVHQQASEVRIRASAGGVYSNIAGQALTLPGNLSDLEASVSPSTVQVTDLADSLAVVNVSAFDKEMDGVRNVRVRFTTTVGTIDRSVITNVNGEATATLTIPAGTPSGTATLRVAAGGLQITDLTVPIVNTGGAASPTPGSSSQPAAIQFVGAQPAVIGVRGSGKPEQSVLTFKVTDGVGNPVSGAQVNFSVPQLADETIAPFQDFTDADGNAQVTLTSGVRALTVQVTAQVTTPSVSLLARSTAVTILGGPPSQTNFSLAHRFANISGRVTFGLQDQVTAFVADRFGNPVPPTAVDFTTRNHGGSVSPATTTNDLGQATATLVSQLPIPDNGIASTLATTVGERPFVDTNGNGVCDDADQLLPVSEPYYDSNCNRVHDPGEDFIDLNGNGVFDDDQLPDPSGQPTCGDRIVVFDSICTTFSGPTSLVLIPSGSGPVEAGGGRSFTVIVSDNPDPFGNPGVGNPIVGGSTLSVTISGGRGRLLGLGSFTLPDAQTNNLIIDGVNRFGFAVVDNAPASTTAETDGVIVTVTSSPGSLPAGGNGSATVQDLITFEAAPTSTPTMTPVPPTATPLPTSTPIPAPPAIAPIQATLSAGTGAPPSACNGPSQTFVVTGGSPPFTVSAGGGCVSVGSVPASGGTFLYTAGNLVGDFTITVTDQLGRSASAGVTVLGPSTPTVTPTVPSTNTPLPVSTSTPTPGAAFIQVDLVDNQASSNGDGTFSSVLTALVTDITGAVVGNGVPVEFSVVPPVAGVSVTSPGLTGNPAPCTLGFTVVPQPGDALSCVKYVQSLAGTQVTVRAMVHKSDGTYLPPADRTFTLPDLRPTATPTNAPPTVSTPTQTSTATSTPTITPTATAAAAHIQVSLSVNKGNDNGDGTVSTAISALVTDSTGAAVGNGIPVTFSVSGASPVGSVSVTSPGITGGKLPCTITAFTVVPQPGDALSCVKYLAAQVGSSVTVTATVSGAGGVPISSDPTSITLPPPP